MTLQENCSTENGKSVTKAQLQPSKRNTGRMSNVAVEPTMPFTHRIFHVIQPMLSATLLRITADRLKNMIISLLHIPNTPCVSYVSYVHVCIKALNRLAGLSAIPHPKCNYCLNSYSINKQGNATRFLFALQWSVSRPHHDNNGSINLRSVYINFFVFAMLSTRQLNKSCILNSIKALFLLTMNISACNDSNHVANEADVYGFHGSYNFHI